MFPDRLFELALQYKKTRLWKKLWDSQLFAVRFSDGEIGYCCVMGMNGEFNAIAVYPGQSGLDSLRTLHEDASGMDDLSQMEQMCSQDCLMLSFVNKSDLNRRDMEALDAFACKHGITLRGRNASPQFERFRPGYERWYLEDETDQRRMIEALEAALEVADRLSREMKTAEMLGITEDAPYDRDIVLLIREPEGFRWDRVPLPPMAPADWPPVTVDDDLSRVRLEKAVRKGEWAVKLARHVEPAVPNLDSEEAIDYDDLTEPPIFPWFAMIVDVRSGDAIGLALSPCVEDYRPMLSKLLVDTVVKFGMPKKIIVLDDRTRMALEVFCGQYEIGLVQKKRCKPLQEALDAMMASFMETEDFDELDDDEIDEMLDMLADPQAVQRLPDELLRMMLTHFDPAHFPREVMDNLRREAIRREFIRK